MEHDRFEGERTLMRIHIGESDRSSTSSAARTSAARQCFAAWAGTAQRASITLRRSCDFRRTFQS
jgi:hypothetical protein